VSDPGSEAQMAVVSQINPVVSDGVVNWWYHYYSYGDGKRIIDRKPVYFTVSPHHQTPDFSNRRYNYKICHPQIGSNVSVGKSIVLVKTAIGRRRVDPPYMPAAEFIVGYFRVSGKDDTWLHMDPNDSLLLLQDPILVNLDWARRLLPTKSSNYWKVEQLSAKFGRSTRNCHANPQGVNLAVSELARRHKTGSRNYLGKPYHDLMIGRKGNPLDDWL